MNCASLVVWRPAKPGPSICRFSHIPITSSVLSLGSRDSENPDRNLSALAAVYLYRSSLKQWTRVSEGGTS